MHPQELAENTRIIEGAIAREREAYRFYAKAAQRTTDSRGKAMFGQLSRDETEHIEILMREYKSITRSGRWLTPEEAAKREAPGHEPLAGLKAKEALVEDTTDDLAAVRIAMQNEVEAKEYYLDGAKRVESPHGKKLFLELADKEDFHFRLLQAEHDSLMGYGFWFDHLEFTLESP